MINMKINSKLMPESLYYSETNTYNKISSPFQYSVTLDSRANNDTTNHLNTEARLEFVQPNSYMHENPYDKVSAQANTDIDPQTAQTEGCINEENYNCPVCAKRFKTKLCLRYHIDVHNPRKPYVCSVSGCDRAFRTPKYLKNHYDEFHKKQPKKYPCYVDGCNAVFQRKTHLKRHFNTHSDAEKKFSCSWPECRYRTCNRDKLNLHYSQHTGEKEYNCILCNFKGVEKVNLSEHYRLEHAKNPENLAHLNSTIFNPYQVGPDTDSNCDESIRNWNSQTSICDKSETMSEYSTMGVNSQKNEPSGNLLPMVLSMLEKTEGTPQMSEEEINNTRSYVKNLLPPISTGGELNEQIQDIYSCLIDKLQEAPDTKSTYLTRAQSFNEDEAHVVEILDHQLRTGSRLTIPYPPRKRGRRPKLQQKLRPYLEKLYNVELCVADMLISLLNCSKGSGWNGKSTDDKKSLDGEEYDGDEMDDYQEDDDSKEKFDDDLKNSMNPMNMNYKTSPMTSIGLNKKFKSNLLKVAPLPSMAQLTSSSGNTTSGALSESGYCSSSQESHSLLNLPITSPNSSLQNPNESPQTLSIAGPLNCSNLQMNNVLSPQPHISNPIMPNNTPDQNHCAGRKLFDDTNPVGGVDHLQFLSEMGAKYTQDHGRREKLSSQYHSQYEESQRVMKRNQSYHNQPAYSYAPKNQTSLNNSHQGPNSLYRTGQQMPNRQKSPYSRELVGSWQADGISTNLNNNSMMSTCQTSQQYNQTNLDGSVISNQQFMSTPSKYYESSSNEFSTMCNNTQMANYLNDDDDDDPNNTTRSNEKTSRMNRSQGDYSQSGYFSQQVPSYPDNSSSYFQQSMTNHNQYQYQSSPMFYPQSQVKKRQPYPAAPAYPAQAQQHYMNDPSNSYLYSASQQTNSYYNNMNQHNPWQQQTPSSNTNKGIHMGKESALYDLTSNFPTNPYYSLMKGNCFESESESKVKEQPQPSTPLPIQTHATFPNPNSPLNVPEVLFHEES